MPPRSKQPDHPVEPKDPHLEQVFPAGTRSVSFPDGQEYEVDPHTGKVLRRV